MRKISFAKWLAISSVIVVLDQVTKIWAIQALKIQDIAVFPGLNFALAHNAGAVFGFLADSSGWQRWFFTAFAIVMMIIIIAWQKSLKESEGGESFALSLVLGGGLGNLIDRVRLGYVIDFIDVYYEQWHWYTFNVADIFICIGATILLWFSVFSRKQRSIFAD
jgi:signal peptidase II